MLYIALVLNHYILIQMLFDSRNANLKVYNMNFNNISLGTVVLANHTWKIKPCQYFNEFI